MNNKLKAARRQLNLTQKGMAKKLRTPLRTYQKWEQGIIIAPGAALVAANLLIDKYLGKQGNQMPLSKCEKGEIELTQEELDYLEQLATNLIIATRQNKKAVRWSLAQMSLQFEHLFSVENQTAKNRVMAPGAE